jgi:heterokaryon incompatibility protein (HET)
MLICDNCRRFKWWMPAGHGFQGSIVDLLSSPSCKSCGLILHLLTALDSKALVKWSKEKPEDVLKQHLFLIISTTPYEAVVKRRYPNTQSWHLAGVIRPLSGLEKNLRYEDNDRSTDEIPRPSQDLIKVLRRSGMSHYRLVEQLKRFRSTQVSFSSMRFLLEQCNSRHRICRPIREEDKDIFSIRLIDVKDGRIIRSDTAQKYFALSYVWGKSKFLQAEHSNISQLETSGSLESSEFGCQIPRTIKDAFHFVEKMNARYLWVDALCKYLRG